MLARQAFLYRFQLQFSFIIYVNSETTEPFTTNTTGPPDGFTSGTEHKIPQTEAAHYGQDEGSPWVHVGTSIGVVASAVLIVIIIVGICCCCRFGVCAIYFAITGIGILTSLAYFIQNIFKKLILLNTN